MLSEEMINHEFSRVFKGYDIEQVEEYIENLISMYEQLANENKEISARFEQLAASFEENRKTVDDAQSLNDEKERILKEACDERDRLIAEAQEQARTIKEEANIKAAGSVESAEGMARRLLSEAKSRAESMDCECEQKRIAAEEQAKKTLDEAFLEAKKLIRATKLNCQKRTEEAEVQLAEIKAEHDRIAAAAADFKRALYEVYSEQLLSIESIEIPDYQLPAPVVSETEAVDEVTALKEEASDKESEIEDIPAIASEGEDDADSEQKDEQKAEALQAEVEEDEADVGAKALAEQSFEFKGGILDYIPEEEEPRAYPSPAPVKKEPKFKPSIYAGIEVQKEHSGQIRYDSRDISSVNRKLDEIISRKGKEPSENKKNDPTKLGFLK